MAEEDIMNTNDSTQDSLFRNEEEMEQSASVTYLLTLGIFIGLVLREVNKKTKFPYSPMVLTVGLLLGLFQSYLGFLGESASLLSHMHPHLIVYVFIPVLLFESAFNCDWHVFKAQMVNILTLAGPGVGWGAILLGIVFKLFLFYSDEDMTWFQAFTLGSVLSATDPVAVVSLLRELGANSSFNHLIEGEALLNDGAAMVFFIFFNKLSKAADGIGGGVGVGGVIINFFQNSFVGPILGVVIGFFGAQWTRRIVGDDVEVSWITFVVTYLTFYWAEFCFFKTSGILAVVALGLFWSAVGKTKIRQESEHAVHSVWSFVQYSCDTTVFLLVGMIVGTEVITEEYIHGSDYFRMLLFYIFMIICRYLMIMSFWPILKKYGYPISQPELIVLVYGGLRGALGLTLSLLVGCDSELPPRFRHLAVFFTAGMAALTNLINGTTCKMLVDYLKMIENPAVKKRVYKSYLKEMIVSSEDKIRELENDDYYVMADWNRVKGLIGQDKLLQQVVGLENELKQLTGGGYSSQIRYEGLGDAETFGEVRYRVLRILKGLYYQKFEYGQCEEDGTRLLVESSDVALDHTREILNVWEHLFQSFTGFSNIQYFFRVKEMSIIGPYAQYYITKHLGFIYDVTTSFIACANEVLTLQGHIPMNQSAVKVIMDELKAEINKAELYLGSMTDTFPEAIRAIQTKRAGHTILMHQRHYLEETQKNGLVDDKEFQALKKDIDSRLVELENTIFDWALPNFHTFAMEFPAFATLDKSDLDNLVKSTYEKRYQIDELIYEKGMTCQNIYIIQKGNVIDEVGQGCVKKGIGSLLSYANLISDGKCLSSARAITECVVHSLNTTVIKQIMAKAPHFEQRVYLCSIDYLIKIYAAQAGPLAQVDSKRLNDFIRMKGQFKKLEINSKVEFMFGGYIFKGEIQSCYQEGEEGIERYTDYFYVPPRENEFTVNKNTVCIIFDDAIDLVKQDRLDRFNLENHEEIIQERYSQVENKQQHFHEYDP